MTMKKTFLMFTTAILLLSMMQGGAFARRVTFYIGIDGTVLKIDSQVNPSTSAQDMVTTLGELGVARAK